MYVAGLIWFGFFWLRFLGYLLDFLIWFCFVVFNLLGFLVSLLIWIDLMCFEFWIMLDFGFVDTIACFCLNLVKWLTYLMFFDWLWFLVFGFCLGLIGFIVFVGVFWLTCWLLCVITLCFSFWGVGIIPFSVFDMGYLFWFVFLFVFFGLFVFCLFFCFVAFDVSLWCSIAVWLFWCVFALFVL